MRRSLLLALALGLGAAPALAQDDEDILAYDDLDDFEFDASDDGIRTVTEDGEEPGEPVELGDGFEDPPEDYASDLDDFEDPIEDFDGIPTNDLAGLGEPPIETDFLGPPEDLAALSDFPSEDPVEDFDRPRAAAPTKTAAVAPAPGVGLDLIGKEPLQDNFPLEVVARDLDAVTVELPVLVGRTKSDFGGTDFWVVAEVLVNGKKVTEARQLVTGASMADLGPSVVWIKAHAPVLASSGTIEVRVGRSDDGASVAPLFVRKGSYRL